VTAALSSIIACDAPTGMRIRGKRQPLRIRVERSIFGQRIRQSEVQKRLDNIGLPCSASSSRIVNSAQWLTDDDILASFFQPTIPRIIHSSASPGKIPRQFRSEIASYLPIWSANKSELWCAARFESKSGEEGNDLEGNQRDEMSAQQVEIRHRKPQICGVQQPSISLICA